VIYYGATQGSLNYKIAVNTVGISTYIVDNLAAGTWYFAVAAVSSDGEESDPSAAAKTTI
jgi:hypothetical protein